MYFVKTITMMRSSSEYNSLKFLYLQYYVGALTRIMAMLLGLSELRMSVLDNPVGFLLANDEKNPVAMYIILNAESYLRRLLFL